MSAGSKDLKIAFRSSHATELGIATVAPVVTLPDAWLYRISVTTGWCGVCVLLLGETADAWRYRIGVTTGWSAYCYWVRQQTPGVTGSVLQLTDLCTVTG